MSDENNKLAKVDQNYGAIEPKNFGELNQLAKVAAESDFFGAKNPSQALMLMMAGKDIGFSYTQSLRAFHVIKGKPSLSADAMVAVCLSRKDLCEFFRCIEETKTSVTWETKRVGNPVRVGTFTMDEAKDAGIVTDMYRKFPKRMLGARCKAYLAREVYPELLMGLYDPDEIEQSAPAQTRSPAFVNRATAQPQVAKVQDAEVVPEDRPTAPETPASKPGPLLSKEQAEILCDEYIAAVTESTLQSISHIQQSARSALCVDYPELYLKFGIPYKARFLELKSEQKAKDQEPYEEPTVSNGASA